MHEQWFNIHTHVYIADIHVKELSHHASCDICYNQLEFSDYDLIIILFADNLVIICPAKNSYGMLVTQYSLL